MIFEIILQNEYIQSIVILSGFIIFGTIIWFFLSIYAKNAAKKTKTEVDDILIEIFTKPIFVFFIIAGFYFALKNLSYLSNYVYLINGFFFIAMVFLGGHILSKILSILIVRWLKVKKKFEKAPQLIKKITSVIIYFIAIIMILGYFRVEITPLIATLGIGSLAIALALQNTLANFFAGVRIISDRPVNVGDFIEMPSANISGYVEDIGMSSTRIRTLPNNIIIIPNSKLVESIIMNDSLPEKETSVYVKCGVSYDSDLEKVEKFVLGVAKKIQEDVKGTIKTFEPTMKFNEFGDSNINFTVVLRGETVIDKYLITHEFIKALKKKFDEEKIEISWPVRKIYQGK